MRLFGLRDLGELRGSILAVRGDRQETRAIVSKNGGRGV